MLERILLPVDFSERCIAMVRSMIPWAKRFGSELVLVHVVPPDTDTSSPEFGHCVTGRRDQRKDAWLRVYEFLRSETADLRVRRAVWEGDRVLRIVQGAQAEDCSLIAMATHGAGTIPRLLAGSVTANVLHNAECPVLTAAHADVRVEMPPGPTSPILCAVGLDAGCTRAIQWASQLGIACSAPVFLLHVSSPGDDAAREARQKIDSLLQRLNATADIADVHIQSGPLTTIINSRLSLLHARLVVIGREPARHSLLHLRCHAYNVVRDSHCPVVSAC